ncbi:MAG: Gfo/Idh/MocA family oxidoreductase, partial [Candidatus Sumerlaeota bacterium]|nr:Gfo/Idh/MocA family oxidoreductase [Candidatus Sumerlaeota bacterium]
LLRETVRGGHFGDIRRLHVKYLQSGLMDENRPLVWRNRKELAGYGALGDLGSHMVDAARFITGAEPKRVVGVANIHMNTKIDPKTGKPARVTTDSDSQFMVDFGSFVGLFETSQVEPAHGNHLVVSVGGATGTARVYSEQGEQLEIACGAPYATLPSWKTCLPWTDVPTSRIRQFKSGRPCIDDFAAAIRKTTKDYPSFEDGLAAQRVLDGILKSMETRRWVAL